MKLRKAISYAYPTSAFAEELGKYKTGCYFIQQSLLREDGLWSPPFAAPGTEGDTFDSPDDPDLIQLYIETEGDPCPYFVRHMQEPIRQALNNAGVEIKDWKGYFK